MADGASDPFLRGLSRLSCDATDYVERNLSSSAMGDNLIKQVDMPGRVGVDIYREVLKAHKLDSYTTPHGHTTRLTTCLTITHT